MLQFTQAQRQRGPSVSALLEEIQMIIYRLSVSNAFHQTSNTLPNEYYAYLTNPHQQPLPSSSSSFTRLLHPPFDVKVNVQAGYYEEKILQLERDDDVRIGDVVEKIGELR